MSRLTSLALLPAALTTACIIPLGSSDIVVDGVKLEEKHTETIEIDAWDASGLTIRSWGGDIHIQSTSGPNRITVTLHELTLDDAAASHEDGRLVAHTTSGEPLAIGDVTVFSNGPLPALDITTGMGDVLVHGVAIPGAARIETGMGDVEVLDTGSPERIQANSGMGSIEVRGTSCGTLEAASGMGDIHVSNVSATEARLEAGLGDVTIIGSHLESVRAETGLGDIDCRDSEIGHHEFDTGLGKVRTR